MCGLAGILSLSPDAPVDPDALRTMAAQLVHRGPDDEGYYVDPQRRCGFGFRRLSIIDLESGHQPIGNEAFLDRQRNSSPVCVVFNGEIYNFRELRRELEQQGHVFTTHSDSEVIAHLYEQHGDGCFARLSGMFAIAIWDERPGRLVLARDRLGKKPLTYATFGQHLYFASEAKAILALPKIPRRLDAQSLHRYLLFQYVPAPHSIFEGFRKLEPGHYVVFHAHDPRPHDPRPFWRLPESARFDGTYAEAKERLGEVLTRAVQRRLIADVPLGAFLSGGIDSSIVVGLMRKLGVTPLRTFSIGFPDQSYDETAYARIVAARFATEHHEHIVTPQAREVLETLAWHYDEPFADTSAIPTYYVSRCARQYVTVALTGDAGDECFAGYDRYRAAKLSAGLDVLPGALRRAIGHSARWVPHSRARTFSNRLYRFLVTVGLPPQRRYLSWINIFTPELLAAGYHPEFRDRIDFDEPLQWFDALYESQNGGAAERVNRVDFLTYLPYDVLTKVDIASMACGLECRAPFLDPEVVEFALSLPFEWRLGSRGTKHILKDWASGFLPAEVISRPKMGFTVPLGEWFRDTLSELLRSRVQASGALSRRIFNAEWLDALMGAHLSGRANYERPLSALLMLELWRDRWQPSLA